MEIILARKAGFCFGVKRATQMAFDAASTKSDAFTLGPIIHSPQVVERLNQLGVRVEKNLTQITSGTVILRSHGVRAEELAEADAKGLDVIDATCPFVRKAQEHVRFLSSEGYTVVVVGEVDHPEVKGIVSYADGPVHVVADGSDVATLPHMTKIGIVAQTTQPFKNLSDVVQACLKRGGEIRIFNTICDATTVRQDEAEELAGQVDCMIVVGGYNSANTCRLRELCAAIQPKTYHIETAEEIDPAWLDAADRVGVTAGASTPKWIIDTVLERLSEIDNSRL